MSIFDKFPAKFLKGVDFDEGGTATIKKVVEEIVGQDGTSKPVVYFREHAKGAVLNVTNARSLAREFGDDESTWPGKKVKLSVIRVRKPGGDMTDSICMEPAPTAKAEPSDPLPF